MKSKNRIRIEKLFSFKATSLIDTQSKSALIVPNNKKTKLPYLNRRGRMVLSEQNNYVFVPLPAREHNSISLWKEGLLWSCVSQDGKIYEGINFEGLNERNYDDFLCLMEDNFENFISFLDENKSFVLETINLQKTMYNERKSRD